MNPEFQQILDFIEQSDHIDTEDKTALIQAIKTASRELEISEFKLERTEKVKRTTAILLEETIEELEQKRKAVEAQNRDLEIEAALEKVRSRSLAMKKSPELSDLSRELVKQVQALGVATWFCAFNIYNDNDSIEWGSNGQGTFENYKTPREGIFLHYYEAGQNGETLLINEIGEDECPAHYEFLCSLPGVGDQLLKMKAEGIPFPASQIDHVAYHKYGYLIFITYKPAPEAHDIFKRFAKVFEQTYTRFLDLQKAEAQAREAVKQASLDRVRGQIASMRHKEDLDRITPLIWDELTTLGVPFIRCGVFIIDPEKENVEVYLSAPDGSPLGVLDFLFNSNDLTTQAVKAWRKEEVYHTHWDKEDFIRWTNYLKKIEQISSQKTYQGGATPPESLDLHFIPFPRGMLYVGNSSHLSDEEIESVKALAKAFSIAYSRYEDFIKLEKAKESIEKTLNELTAAQKQLIHSEKMASLGELTAGIAHEIKNPLNFVNNFSEVSKELLQEMKEELDSGHMEEVKEIVDDVISNLEKITHHGQRADSIVRGMLQHSRTNTGEKEATDINNLVDEYLRLAYHGMRAKDKSFNVAMNTDYDESIGKIEIIPQDIGRVLLNLITNAFYACTEKNKKQKKEMELAKPGEKADLIDHDEYHPAVTVCTKLLLSGGESKGDQVEISVEDNGSGIPSKVLEKIFQPFFTTKPAGSGTGLGLSLSYDIVKAHGGELKVETDEGEGTEFVIVIPKS